MNKSIKLICSSEGDEFMAHYPNGSIEFLGFWGMCKFIWWATWNNYKVIVIDGKTGKEA